VLEFVELYIIERYIRRQIMRKKTSQLWKIPKEEMEKIVKANTTFSGILRYFKVVSISGSFKTLKSRLNQDNIDYSHIRLGSDSNIGKRFFRTKIPLEQVMVENSTYGRGHLKERLIKDKILEEKCKICGQLPLHNGIDLILVLDHINGVNNDNRLDNLRLLCPNCNSQQSTFAGRKTKKKYFCIKCGKEKKSKRSKFCCGCSPKYHQVENRPTIDILLKNVQELGYCGTGRKYGVTDNAIRKWIKKES
jgi:Zn finger protein HypA/HybF involved in hydrogenase expression